MLGKIESRRNRGQQRMRWAKWHYLHHGHEFEKISGNSEGQGSLMSPIPGCRVGHDWATQFSSVAQSCLTLQPQGLQHTRLPCPSPTPGAYSNSCPSSQWCHPTISSSVVSFSPTFNLFQNQGFSNELAFCIRWPKYWSFSFSLNPSKEYSGLISFRMDWLDFLAVQGTQVFPSTTVQKHQFFSAQPSLWTSSHIHTWLLEKP